MKKEISISQVLQEKKVVQKDIAISQPQPEKEKKIVELTVSDDGRGIDIGKLKAAAVKLGKISPNDADELDIAKAELLAFQSGITTSPIVTDISGRGLGLAIVQEKVEKLGGTISVESMRGQGVRFTLLLPVTIASFRGIFIRSAGQVFIVPTTNVERVMRIKPEEIQTVENRNIICVDCRNVPLVSLSDALELSRTKESGDQSRFIQAFILKYAGKRIAFSVEEILRDDEGLVKNLGSHLSKVRAVSGAAIYGKGNIAPIIHVPDLMDCAVNVTKRDASSHVQTEVSEKKSVLVAEDSVTSRMLLKNILESGGYFVKTAVDGIDALTALKENRYDILVSDVDMPRMNGFMLTEKIRNDKVLSDLPVILVTARDSREDRERGIDSGANAYIVKSSFEQSNLLEVIQRFV
ncbi:MAG: response regulator [Desulfamplus sp.]|nr:response regulator [Desulfamplus sp.]